MPGLRKSCRMPPDFPLTRRLNVMKTAIGRTG